MMEYHPTQDFRNLFVGLDVQTPIINGNHKRYINFDNAASTPALEAVRDAVDKFLVYYSSVHRGTGFKSQLSTHAYEQARHTVMRFLGADPTEHTCIFGKNTTEAINKLARRFPFTSERNIVLASAMEHHSNDLPWRAATRTVHIKLTPEGRLDEDDFDAKLRDYGPQVALVAITGASNVTGYINPIHRLAEKSHSVGSQILVDCAQLAPHRKITMGQLDDPAHLDFVSISAHKMYAPFGTGALVGRRDIFEQGDPDLRGGGTVEIVTLDDVVWAEPPDRDEAGSPNTVGAVALAAAIHKLEQVGMDNLARHESQLTNYALRKLPGIDSLHIYGNSDPQETDERLGVIPLSLDDKPHFLIAAILGHEFGIGVRSGCFCAHPYILQLLNLTQDESKIVRQNILNGDRSDMPGLIRVSFGLYNTIEEIDELVFALDRIIRGDYHGDYIQELSTGEYSPRGWSVPYDHYFSFE
jgi:cysteine desulfurase / selenocysteine lyase